MYPNTIPNRYFRATCKSEVMKSKTRIRRRYGLHDQYTFLGYPASVIYMYQCLHATLCAALMRAYARSVRLLAHRPNWPAGAVCGMQLLFNVYARLLANQVTPPESLICEQVCERIVAYPNARAEQCRHRFVN